MRYWMLTITHERRVAGSQTLHCRCFDRCHALTVDTRATLTHEDVIQRVKDALQDQFSTNGCVHERCDRGAGGSTGIEGHAASKELCFSSFTKVRLTCVLDIRVRCSGTPRMVPCRCMRG